MKENGKKKKKLKDSFLTTALSFLILFPMLILMLPTVVFFFLGMLPTFIALVIDASSKTKMKYKWLCIGGLNFAGALPFMFRLWFGSNTLDGAINLFLSNASFLVIYLAAAIGWVFYRCIPPVVLNFLEMNDQRRVVHLRELQAKLVAKWGEEVIEGADINKTAAVSVKKPVPSVSPGQAAVQAAAAAVSGEVKKPSN